MKHTAGDGIIMVICHTTWQNVWTQSPWVFPVLPLLTQGISLSNILHFYCNDHEGIMKAVDPQNMSNDHQHDLESVDDVNSAISRSLCSMTCSAIHESLVDSI